ncbi:putative Vacuolar protein sorting-associated protein 27 [Cocos nucifera]|uniref:Putative Vacuolar protein sorting-associated protein 27 n=1 Tax=Cocos nucifera TaxID=13894 RepID=A0A8K0MVC5_COCNU|nr:putative Vacuolar protein sorting-associated protein 27 [Cocos nucifera]
MTGAMKPGNLKHALKHEEEILGQILGTDGKQHLSSGQESQADAISDHQKFGSSAPCSSLNQSVTTVRELGVIRSTSVEMHNTVHTDVVSGSPEQLRQQAVEEKKMYKILKAQGKSEEALQAFKHGKELERQAGALEIAIRKSRRMASKASNSSSAAGTQNTDEREELGGKRKLPSQRSKNEKDNLAAELRDLGWSDADLHDADKKSAKVSLQGELSNLLGEITPKSSQGRKTGGIDKSQITAHKKKALLLKREGKLGEAKEELKKAKILEKQLEEQELLGEDEDSDDELSALIRSMDDYKQDDLLLDHAPDPDGNFNYFPGVIDDLAIDGNFEVTDDDVNDPELAAALKSFRWSEEDDQVTNHVMQSVAVDRDALQSQVLALKREALSQKQAGNTAEAMELLKKAKLLERDLETTLLVTSSLREYLRWEYKLSSSARIWSRSALNCPLILLKTRTTTSVRLLFSKNLKLSIHEDSQSKAKLAELPRIHFAKSKMS